MSDFTNLAVWQRSRRLAHSIFEATRSFPPAEIGGMVSQMRRSSVSIAANIAEGSARHSRKDQTRFYRTGLASARELEAPMILSGDRGIVTAETGEALHRDLEEVQRMLSGLIRYSSGGGRRTRNSEPNSQPNSQP